jgi:hypothetical protein
MRALSERGAWFVPALVALVAAAGGLAAGWFLRGDAARPEPPARALERETSEAVTREQLEALETRILAELRKLARPGPDGTSAPVTPDAAVNELGRRIDELDARIALLDTKEPRRDGSSLWTPPKGPGSGSIEAIIERMQAWYHPSHTERRGDDIETQLHREHDLWTFDDIVRAYAAPRRWERREQGWNLFYGCFEVEGWELKQSIVFCLRDGYLSQIEISDCQP